MTNPKGRFGVHGGQYLPETLMNAVLQLEEAYDFYKEDPVFQQAPLYQNCVSISMIL